MLKGFASAFAAMLLLALPHPVMAQSTDRLTIPPEKAVLIERYLRAAEVGMLGEGLVQSVIDSEARDRVSPAELEIMRGAAVEASRRTMPLLIAEMSLLYANAFSVEELKALVEFYESPNGRSVIQKTTAITDQLAGIFPTFRAQFERTFSEVLCARTDCEALFGEIDRPGGDAGQPESAPDLIPDSPPVLIPEPSR